MISRNIKLMMTCISWTDDYICNELMIRQQYVCNTLMIRQQYICNTLMIRQQYICNELMVTCLFHVKAALNLLSKTIFAEHCCGPTLKQETLPV